MSQKVFNFKEDLKKSEKNTDILIEKFKLIGYDVEKGNGTEVDIYINGVPVELKFDQKAEEYGNLFMELWSSRELLTIGGPWKAKKNNCQIILYCLPTTNQFYLAYTNDLVSYLDSQRNSGILLDRELRNVKNKCEGSVYTTQGWPISIKKLLKDEIFTHYSLEGNELIRKSEQ